VTLAADPKYNLCEVSVLECEDGTLVAFLRENSRKGYDILKTLSRDGGETWSELYPTPMDCGHRPVSGFLRDGRVMVTYRYIPSATQNTFAAFFEPEALTETDRRAQRGRIMPLDYDRNPSPDLGYTGWVQFEDGEIYVVNYIKDDADKAYIRGYSFRPEDVLLPLTENCTKNVF
jgi:sialidase-1